MLSASFQPFFDWCGKTWLGSIVRDTTWAFPVLETFHLLALAILLGTVLIINLRAFGIGVRYLSETWTDRELEPWMVTSLAILIATGIPMFLSEPEKCYESYSFPIKMMLLVVAIVWHFAVQRKWSARNPALSPGFKGRLIASLSILLWLCIGVAGKGIPYV